MQDWQLMDEVARVKNDGLPTDSLSVTDEITGVDNAGLENDEVAWVEIHGQENDGRNKTDENGLGNDGQVDHGL